MIKKNSLMEWLAQTKKLSKSVDYITMQTIDFVLNYLWAIDTKTIAKHKKILTRMSLLYHKPNPLDIAKNYRKAESYFLLHHGGITLKDWLKKIVQNYHKKSCKIYHSYKECRIFQLLKKTISYWADGSLIRCEQAYQDITWQWFEVIDFMYDRPELINPSLIDEYIEGKINEVCAENNKNNPLADGYRDKFGKCWKDEKGGWHKEKRIRF